MRDEALHHAAVDEWLDKAGTGLSNDQLLQLFEVGMAAIWGRSLTILGDVTLTAIAGRVIHDVRSKYPALGNLTVQRERGIQSAGVREQAAALSTSELRAALGFVLVRFLSVLGTLTSELLTPELHGELSKVALAKAES